MHMQLRKKGETCDFTKKVCKGTNILTNFLVLAVLVFP